MMVAAMNRRKFAASLALSIPLIGCDTEQKPSHTATLLNNSDVQEAIKSLAAAIDSLEGDTGRFDSENWREVVPDVETAATDVRDAFDRLRQALQVPNS